MNYLGELREYLKLESSIKDGVLLELNGHLEDKSRDLVASGLSDEAARLEAIKSLGSSRLLAKQIYEVYSQGTWKQALCAALPHFLVAVLFALHLLPSLIWLACLLLLSMAAVIYGWCRGKPAWLFPWLGSLLSPAIITGIALIYLPNGWTWFAALTYIPLAVLVLIMVTKQTLKRDWLFISLMLLPVPIVLGWVLAFSLGNTYFNPQHIYESGLWIALSFVVLALTVVIFVRARQRWLKIWTLVIPEILIITVVVLNSQSNISFWGWLLLSLLALTLMFCPALIERKYRRT
jgi:hypothetical protein